MDIYKQLEEINVFFANLSVEQFEEVLITNGMEVYKSASDEGYEFALDSNFIYNTNPVSLHKANLEFEVDESLGDAA